MSKTSYNLREEAKHTRDVETIKIRVMLTSVFKTRTLVKD